MGAVRRRGRRLQPQRVGGGGRETARSGSPAVRTPRRRRTGAAGWPAGMALAGSPITTADGSADERRRGVGRGTGRGLPGDEPGRWVGSGRRAVARWRPAAADHGRRRARAQRHHQPGLHARRRPMGRHAHPRAHALRRPGVVDGDAPGRAAAGGRRHHGAGGGGRGLVRGRHQALGPGSGLPGRRAVGAEPGRLARGG